MPNSPSPKSRRRRVQPSDAVDAAVPSAPASNAAPAADAVRAEAPKKSPPAKTKAASPSPANPAAASQTAARKAPAKKAAAKKPARSVVAAAKAAAAEPDRPPEAVVAEAVSAESAPAAAARKAPAKKAAATAKKSPAKKPPAKTAPAGKTPAKEASAKAAPAKEAPAKEAPAKKAATKKTPARKSADKPRAARRTVERPAPATPDAPDSAPAAPSVSRLVLEGDDRRRLAWSAGAQCPRALAAAARDAIEAGDEAAERVSALLRDAAAAGHRIEVDEGVWPHLAAARDARRRLARLQAAYAQGAADPALGADWRITLAPFQAEGALWAVVAGRALLADECAMGKGVQAIAAALLGRRHFGLRRVLVVCAAAQRTGWQRAWRRVAGVEAAPAEAVTAQPAAVADMADPLADMTVRLVAAEALDAASAGIAAWAPELTIVDEPQHLRLSTAQWDAVEAPALLVLCGAALDTHPALLEAIVDRLDRDRLGALAALREVQAARAAGASLADAEIERLDLALSRLLLQRQRADVEDQLPARVWSERLLSLTPAQQQAHDQALRRVRRLVAGWRASRWLADADQWRLADALRAMRAAGLREPAAPASAALAESALAAATAQLDEWALDGLTRVAVAGASSADREALAQRLGRRPGLVWIDAGHPVPAAAAAVLLLGTPWNAQAWADADGAPRGRPWRVLLGAGSFDQALYDTLDARQGVPDGPGELGWLDGAVRDAWVGAIDAALNAGACPQAGVAGGDGPPPGA